RARRLRRRPGAVRRAAGVGGERAAGGDGRATRLRGAGRRAGRSLSGRLRPALPGSRDRCPLRAPHASPGAPGPEAPRPAPRGASRAARHGCGPARRSLSRTSRTDVPNGEAAMLTPRIRRRVGTLPIGAALALLAATSPLAAQSYTLSFDPDQGSGAGDNTTQLDPAYGTVPGRVTVASQAHTAFGNNPATRNPMLCYWHGDYGDLTGVGYTCSASAG